MKINMKGCDFLSHNIDYLNQTPVNTASLFDPEAFVTELSKRIEEEYPSQDTLLTDKLNCHSITEEWVERTVRDT